MKQLKHFLKRLTDSGYITTLITTTGDGALCIYKIEKEGKKIEVAFYAAEETAGFEIYIQAHGEDFIMSEFEILKAMHDAR